MNPFNNTTVTTIGELSKNGDIDFPEWFRLHTRKWQKQNRKIEKEYYNSLKKLLNNL